MEVGRISLGNGLLFTPQLIANLPKRSAYKASSEGRVKLTSEHFLKLLSSALGTAGPMNLGFIGTSNELLTHISLMYKRAMENALGNKPEAIPPQEALNQLRQLKSERYLQNGAKNVSDINSDINRGRTDTLSNEEIESIVELYKKDPTKFKKVLKSLMRDDRIRVMDSLVKEADTRDVNFIESLVISGYDELFYELAERDIDGFIMASDELSADARQGLARMTTRVFSRRGFIRGDYSFQLFLLRSLITVGDKTNRLALDMLKRSPLEMEVLYNMLNYSERQKLSALLSYHLFDGRSFKDNELTDPVALSVAVKFMCDSKDGRNALWGMLKTAPQTLVRAYHNMNSDEQRKVRRALSRYLIDTQKIRRGLDRDELKRLSRVEGIPEDILSELLKDELRN